MQTSAIVPLEIQSALRPLMTTLSSEQRRHAVGTAVLAFGVEDLPAGIELIGTVAGLGGRPAADLRTRRQREQVLVPERGRHPPREHGHPERTGQARVAPAQLLQDQADDLGGLGRLEGQQLVHADAEAAELGKHLPQRRARRDDLLRRHSVQSLPDGPHHLGGEPMHPVQQVLLPLGQRCLGAGHLQGPARVLIPAGDRGPFGGTGDAGQLSHGRLLDHVKVVVTLCSLAAPASAR